MENAQNLGHFLEHANKLLGEGKSFESIRNKLLESGADSDLIETIVKQVKAQRYLIRRKRGFVLGVTGSILLVAGFILTVIFYHSNVSFQYVMYTTTSIGAILLVAGLVEVIGW